MKILVLQDHLRSGGTERQSVLLANAFAAAGHSTTLLTFRPGGALAGTVNPAVNRHSLQPFDLQLDWFAPGLFRFCNQLQPEAILCMGRMANCYGGGLQRQHPRAVVIGTMRTGKKLPRLFRRSLAIVRHVVANSRDARDTLVRDHAVPVEKISVIHNSLVFPAGASSTPASVIVRENPLRLAQGATPTTTVLLCVAMFRPEKNQRELIEIAAGLPSHLEWQLWLAGDGPARADCERLVATRQLGSRVKFLGLQRDPSPLYAAADIAVHASASEALSNFLIEAQAHGLPVVAYAAQGISECFVPGRTGWVIPRGDHAAFHQTIARLMALPASERSALAIEAQRYARETFDPTRQVAAYLNLLQNLVSSPPA
jgi:glycosyltransferase involved in cell wall biosynthesis